MMPICPSKGLGIASRVSGGPLMACELRPANRHQAPIGRIYFLSRKNLRDLLPGTSDAVNTFADNPLILLICDLGRPIEPGQLVQAFQLQARPNSHRLRNILTALETRRNALTAPAQGMECDSLSII